MKTALSRRNPAALLSRIRDLEDEVQECRQLNRRLAELTDVVVELLVPLAEQNPRAREVLERYLAGVSDQPSTR